MHLALPEWLKNIGHLSFTLNNQVAIFLMLIIIVVILSYIINMILLASIGGIYRLFIAPGVIVHEMSHALGCMLTGAKINSINVFKKDGGEVRHAPSKIPIIGPIIISLAPFVIGALVIYFLAKFVGIHTLQYNSQEILTKDPVGNIWQMLKSIDFHQVRSWLSLYLIIAIAVTMTPSTQDFRNIVFSLIFLILILFVLIKYLGLHLSFEVIARPEIIAILGSCVAILIVALFLSILVAVASGIVRR